MKLDIYPSQKTTPDTAGCLYIAVPAGQSIPSHVVAAMGPFGPLFKTIDVNDGDKRVAMDVLQTLADVADHGFAVLSAAVIVTVG